MLMRKNLDNIDVEKLVEDNFYLPYLDSGQLYNNLKNKCIKSARKYESELIALSSSALAASYSVFVVRT